MEIGVIAVLAVLSLALAATLVVTLRKPGLRQERIKEVLENVVDPKVADMKTELNKVSELVRELEKDRENKFGQLTSQLKTVGEQASALATTTGQLREALANTRIRGQWGERMAEDVLRLTGFVEGVNYLKQATSEESRSRPDYTFLLPQNMKLNMDVKFPLINYQRCLEAKDPEEEARFRRQFVKDVRDRLKEVVTRDYIDPGQKTLDYVLAFIPNEQIFQYVHEHDSSLIDDALRHKVVLCSPVSLFAILVVIRQALDNFALEQSSNQIIGHIGTFHKQWAEFVKQMDTVGQRITSAQNAFNLLSDRRRRALERPLDRIAAIREQQGLDLLEELALEESEAPDEQLALEPSDEDSESVGLGST